MPAGRPSKYTPELAKQIANDLRLGMFVKHACANAGIDESTMAEWAKKYPDFQNAITDAKQASVRAALGCYRSAIASGDWRAAGDYLDRTQPDYRKSTDINVKHDIQVLAVMLAEQFGIDPEELAVEAEAMIRALPSKVA